MPPLHPRILQALRDAESGQVARAEADLKRLMRDRRLEVDACNSLAAILAKQGKYEPAIFHARRAAELRPDDDDLQYNLGAALLRGNRLGEAEDVLGPLTRRRPADLTAGTDYALVLLNQKRLSDCEAACRRVLEHDPGHPTATALLANVLRGTARLREALVLLRGLQRDHPHDHGIAESVAFSLLNDPDATPRQITAAHANYGRLVELIHDAPAAAPAARPSSGRRLELALLSHDLHAHSVSWFAESILEHLPRDRWRVTCYHTGAAFDEVSRRLAGKADAFHHLPRIGSAELAARVRAEGIDVLAELSGLTTGHRLYALMERPAPVQLTYIGYPCTTGLRRVDWRVVDSLTDPPGSEALCVEGVARLDPCFLCYAPSPGMLEIPPAAAAAPARGGGGFVFGSFNAGTKINHRVVEAWSRLLLGAPGSRLLLKNQSFGQAESREWFLRSFEERGVGRERLEVVPWTASTAEHLRMYHRVDLALDTFPYNGTTTTCEALLMGVPVLGLRGDWHAGRVGVSLLTNVGLADMLAPDVDGYVSLGAALAGDLARLESRRAGLRERFLASPVCDGPGYGARLSELLLDLHRRAEAKAAAAG